MTRKRPQDSPRDWYQMKAATADAPAEVMIYDEIGWYGVTAANFTSDLKAIDAEAITVRLNSPGGDVYDGISILNSLRDHPATITVIVDGLAASAASFIAMAGEEIVMGRNSELMIHDAWGMAVGNAADLAKLSANLDRVSNNIASIYADRAGGTPADWREVMRAETWYSADEAVAAGLADRVQEKPADDAEVAARFDLSVFNYAGRSQAPAPLRSAPRAESDPTAGTSPQAVKPGSTEEGGSPVAITFTDEQETSIRDALGLAVDADGDAIVAAIEDLATKPAAEAPPAALAEGVVAIDQSVLVALQASAARGEAAARRQEDDDRTSMVDTAVRNGQIAPARREHWLNSIKADAGQAEVLAGLAHGLIPVSEIGHGQDVQDSGPDVFAQLFGSEA